MGRSMLRPYNFVGCDNVMADDKKCLIRLTEAALLIANTGQGFTRKGVVAVFVPLISAQSITTPPRTPAQISRTTLSLRLSASGSSILTRPIPTVSSAIFVQKKKSNTITAGVLCGSCYKTLTTLCPHQGPHRHS